MKLSLNWLKEYIDHGLSADELAFRMTMAGLEVEGIHQVGADIVFDIEVTPNRPDCLNILGLGREISAITDKDLKEPAARDHADAGSLDISIEDTDGCGRYIGTLIDGVHVQAFVAAKAALLQALGLKTISNCVDITNFVLFEFGQPLHVFDADKLEGGKIIVRRARKGEKIVTLDDIERELDESILVIADAKKPVAIAGIMGGRDTGVTSATKRIILESAFFDMGLIRRASRKLGLTSDSAYRFERGVDFSTVEKASDRAADMLLELAGGNIAARRDVAVREMAAARPAIVVLSDDMQNLLGTKIEILKAKRILERLACGVTVYGETMTVVPPQDRQDLRIKEDIIEEVARVIGFDNLPMSLPSVGAINIPVDQQREDFNRHVADDLIAQGFNEILTHAMVSRPALEKTGYDGVKPMAMQNPMSGEQELMKPAVLANMLEVVAFNINHGQKDLRLFEIGKRYLPAEAGGERWTLGLVMTGRREGDWRKGKREPFDFFDIKGVIESALLRRHISGLAFVAGHVKALEPGQSADILLNKQPVGMLGRIADEVLNKFEIKKAQVYFAEIDLEALLGAWLPREKFSVPEAFPMVIYDVSLALKDGAFEDLRAECLSAGQGLLKKVELVEEYCGDKIEKGHRGLVLSLIYQAKDRTLTDAEVGPLHESIVARLIEKFGAKRR